MLETPAAKAQRALSTLEHYQQSKGEARRIDPDTAKELLTDIFHLFRLKGWSLETNIRRAKMQALADNMGSV